MAIKPDFQTSRHPLTLSTFLEKSDFSRGPNKKWGPKSPTVDRYFSCTHTEKEHRKNNINPWRIVRLNSECYCNRPIITLAKSMDNMSCIRRGVSVVALPHGTSSRSSRRVCGFVVVSHGTSSRSSSRGCGGVRASMVDSYESSSDFVKRMEQAWLISEQPMPVACSSCDSDGEVECHWCRGTGFFILGDNILCQVPSRNTSCVICAGKGSMRCSDCKGTGFRAGWLGKPPISK